MSRPFHSSVLHVEGMDLAGKSTVTRYVCETTARRLQRNSLTPRNLIYHHADERRRQGADARTLGPAYVEALAWDLAHLLPDGPRVQDSTILLRSLAFNAVLGHSDIVTALEALVPKHPMFGLTVVLTASIEARVQRLAERQRLAPEEVAPDDLMVIGEPELFLAMESALFRYADRFFNAVELNTSNLSKTQTQAAVTRLLDASSVTG